MTAPLDKGASEGDLKSGDSKKGDASKVEANASEQNSLSQGLTPADWQSAKKESKADAGVATNLPAVELESKLTPAAILTSNASAEEKIKAVEALGRAGQTSVEIVDKDGSKRNLTIELEKAGARTLVHLYAADEQGKERVVLRGIKNADGSYQQQQTEAGDKVGSYGTWWSKNMGDRSYFSEMQTARDEPAKTGDSNLFPDKRNAIAPERKADVVEIKPAKEIPEVKIEEVKKVVEIAPTKDVTPTRDVQELAQLPVIPADRAVPQPLDGQPFYVQQNQEIPAERAGRDVVVPFKEQVPQRVVTDQERLNELFDGIASRANRSRRMTQVDDGTVYFRAGMAIDADGSPRARKIDPYGQSETSLRYKNGASVNAETVNYFVLPLGKYQQYGVRKGDIAAVRYGDEVRFAVFADAGPSHKLGEGSMALAASLGINNNPRNGGTHRPEVEYIVFPGSGNGRPLHNDAHQDLGRHYLGKAYRRNR